MENGEIEFLDITNIIIKIIYSVNLIHCLTTGGDKFWNELYRALKDRLKSLELILCAMRKH